MQRENLLSIEYKQATWLQCDINEILLPLMPAYDLINNCFSRSISLGKTTNIKQKLCIDFLSKFLENAVKKAFIRKFSTLITLNTINTRVPSKYRFYMPFYPFNRSIWFEIFAPNLCTSWYQQFNNDDCFYHLWNNEWL